MASPNTQTNAHQKTLSELQGTDNSVQKSIDPADRQAINDALTDQTTMELMHKQGTSSKKAREKESGMRKIPFNGEFSNCEYNNFLQKAKLNLAILIQKMTEACKEYEYGSSPIPPKLRIPCS